ncbi:MAG: hypothetical protein HQP61_09395 [Peptococcaceae bacterium]|nr:hypothetical protein [Candidatus Syntrophopropionicum ammoniitolerans]
MRRLFLTAVILLLIASLFGCTTGKQSDQTDCTDDNEAIVKQLVEGFGAQLKHVSLLTPARTLQASLQEHYNDYISETLLATWQNDLPKNTPGLLVSSPWPDRIEVLGIEKLDADVYMVEGTIVEITGANELGEGKGINRPVTLRVKKFDNGWLIDGVMLDAYPESSGIIYRNNEYGFSFSLPDSWEGYKILTRKWQGVTSAEFGQEIAGPLILIRHPHWTVKEPRQDIPIMVFTVEQWETLMSMGFSVSAAPVPPRELDRNERYIFTLPARYNFAFPTGFEEVEKIMESNPLRAD